MSYDPNFQSLPELVTAWNSNSESLPNIITQQTSLNKVFSLNTIGISDSTLSSNVISLPYDSAHAYFVGDFRSESSSANFNIWALKFTNSDGALATGSQKNRNNLGDDQCYSIASTARLECDDVLRMSGASIAPFVRVIGVLMQETLL
jgi:hypothetical protein